VTWLGKKLTISKVKAYPVTPNTGVKGRLIKNHLSGKVSFTSEEDE